MLPVSRRFANPLRVSRARLLLEALEDRCVLATLVVNSSLDAVADDGVLTLREAINAVNTQSVAGLGFAERTLINTTQPFGVNDTIQFAAGLSGQTITLSGPRFNLTRSVTINGLGADRLTIDGADGRQLFHVDGSIDSTVTVNLHDLRLRGGRAVNPDPVDVRGGAVFNNGGILNIRRCRLDTNNATQGGAVYNFGGTTRIENSTLEKNNALSGFGTALVNNGGTTDLVQCTVTGNLAFGTTTIGAVFNQGGTVNITQCTFAENFATSSVGPGAAAVFTTSGCVTTIQNSVFLANLALAPVGGAIPKDVDQDAGAVVSGANNFFGSNIATSFENGVNGNIVSSTAPNFLDVLTALGNYGGTTPTYLPARNSPILDRGSNALIPAGVTTDQRGASFSRTSGTVDMGAVELQPLTLVVDLALDEDDGILSPGDLSLREAIGLANVNPGADSIRFAAALNGQPLNLTLGQMVITETVTITGNGAASTILDALQRSRILDVASTAGDMTLDGLTLRNGRTTAVTERGGAIRFSSPGTLTIRNSTLSGNSTTGGSARGGAVYCSAGGGLTVTNSTLSGNFTAGDHSGGGAIFMGSLTGEFAVTNSTLSGNFTTGDSSSGGAISTFTGRRVTVANSTLSGNSTAGVDAGGGAIYAVNGELAVTNSTVVLNQAQNASGGGILRNLGPVTITNSILAQNSDAGIAPDVRSFGSLTVRASLIGDSTGTGLAPGNGNLLGTAANPLDPRLGPLTNNGGPTQTHALLPGSPALNAGDNTLAAGLTTDQRGPGFSRFGGRVDMGAFEDQSSGTDRHPARIVQVRKGKGPKKKVMLNVVTQAGLVLRSFKKKVGQKIALADRTGDGILDVVITVKKQTGGKKITTLDGTTL